MQHKQTLFNFKGMFNDLSPLNTTAEHAFKIKNMRFITDKPSSLLSLTNEKGNKKVDLDSNILGVPIGQSSIDDTVILFTTTETESLNKDTIYKINLQDNKVSTLFSGNLNFSAEHPLEILFNYENEDNIKLYWVDGINPFRVINIKAAEENMSKWNNDSFNAVPTINFGENVTITKNYYGGTFSPGTIQYAFTYFNLYGQESNIFYISDLYYTSFTDRGGSPEETVSNSFTLNIKNADSNFDYIRIYSIHRTSLNATPSVKVVADIKNSSNIVYTDTNTTGYTIDPTTLLYLGGESIIANTLSQKDNTLFLGNFKIEKLHISDDIKDFFNNFSSNSKLVVTTDSPLELTKKSIYLPNDESYYPYENQLKYSSRQIKTFKYLETYRFGIQFQHKTGKWSEPVWIEDARINVPIKDTYDSDSETYLPVIYYHLEDSKIIKKLLSLGFIKARPVVVYPSESDRECICQGVLCPTVYYAKDRNENAPFAQSSWFIRPNRVGSFKSYDNGAFLEFRHNRAIPNNTKRNAEIQSIGETAYESCYIKPDTEINGIALYHNFYIDQSIITMHSPDIEFNSSFSNTDLSTAKLRIIGLVPLTAFSSDIDIICSSGVLPYRSPLSNGFKASTVNLGLYKKEIKVKNILEIPTGKVAAESYFGSNSLVSSPIWIDGIYNSVEMEEESDYKAASTIGAFAIYPWHKEGSLNNTPETASFKYSELKRKVMSNLKYSYKSQYFKYDDIWNAFDNSNDRNGISDAVICDVTDSKLYKIKAPKGSNREDIIYYSNVNKLISPYEDALTYYQLSGWKELTDLRELLDKSFAEDSYKKDYTDLIGSGVSGNLASKAFVNMKYKSSPHVVCALNYSKDEKRQIILPTLKVDNPIYNGILNDLNEEYSSVGTPFWEKNNITEGVYQHVLDIPYLYNTQHGFLWLGELYRDTVKNRFGGTTEESFENNEWLPAGDAISLYDEFGNQKTLISIKWTEGDTYYQRYDHLKTYPFTQEDSNSIVEIVSFMCETRVNLDGRYDRNRGLQSNLNISPQNFNLMNSVYSQQDNIFVYRGLNTDKQILNNFPTTITWTKTKTAGEIVDTWTNITLASTLDFDGSKGSINAIRKYNNNLIVFQDDALAELMYNSNTQIASTVGVPIEIANSGKVDGKRYFAEIGCTNKWSICMSPQGLYFISKYNKDIYCYADKLYNLSSTLYFDTWVNNTYKGVNTWDPYNFNNIVSYYDPYNSDILFITKDECLAYSEKLGKFSSFYSYENTPYFINVGNKVITVKYNSGTCELWEQNAGDYNSFFGNYKPFGITFISNGESSNDKIFNTLDLRAEVFSNEEDVFKEPFDTLNTWNSYQEGTSNLKDIKGFTSNIKKKFRIWRVNVPRDNSNGRDRMRNPWLYLELLKQNPNTDKTVLHNITVNYFE